MEKHRFRGSYPRDRTLTEIWLALPGPWTPPEFLRGFHPCLLERRKQRAWDDVVLSKTSRNDLLRRDILMTWVRLLAVTEPNTAG